MKRLLTILILIFTLQTPSWADDIRDFQIEGMSIGDSLLEYYSEKEIKKETVSFKETNYKDDSFSRVGGMSSKSLKSYDAVQFHFKKGDPKYIIYSLEGINFFKSMKTCISDNKKISNDIKKLFPNSKKKIIQDKHGADPSGKVLFI